MRTVKIKDRVIIVNNEQYQLIEKIEKNKYVFHDDLDEREQIVAQQLYSNDILLKKKLNGRLVYIFNK